jgi:thiol-disulfide isomerase/thioredoxin
MKIKLPVLALLALPFSVCGQLKIGDKVDLKQMNLTALNNAQIDADKMIVLDFWATWCAPCIASFPHLDSIQKSFQKNVQVIAVSDESPLKVAGFLEKRRYSFSFFLDENKGLFKLFDVERRPLTAVIRQDGTLLWVGNSGEVGAVLSNDAGNPLTPVLYSQQKYYEASGSSGKEKPIYLYQISLSDTSDIYEAKTQKSSSSDRAIDIYYRGVSIPEVLQDLLNVSSLQFVNNRPDLDTTLVNLLAKSTSKHISYTVEKEKIILDLQRIFNFTLKKESKMVDAYCIEIIDSKKLSNYIDEISGGGMVQSDGNNYNIMRLSLPELASFFEKKLKVFVSFQGDELDKFNLVLEKFKTIEDLNKQLETKFGLKLKPSEASILIIEIN